jgi:hypothetical protein
VWERKEASQAMCEWSAKIRLPLAGAQLSFAAWPISLQYMEGVQLSFAAWPISLQYMEGLIGLVI